MADDNGDPAAQAAAQAQQQATQLQAQQQIEAQAKAAATMQAQALAAAQEVARSAAAAGVNIDAAGLVTDFNKQTQEKSTTPYVICSFLLILISSSIIHALKLDELYCCALLFNLSNLNDIICYMFYTIF